MRDITSKDNQVYKLFKRLTTRKYRDSLGLYLIEGEKLIKEALTGRALVDKVIIRKGQEDQYAELVQGLACQSFSLDERLFKDMAQTMTSQGIMAAVKKPEFSLEEFAKDETPGNFVVLDRLQDPGNIGTIIRTADAAGYKAVIAMKGTADVFSPKVARSATGSLFRVPVIELEHSEELLELARKTGKRLVATSLEHSTYYYEQDLTQDIALIIGNEGQGVSQELLDMADIKVKIPMRGNIESLNASVAAAIIMYEAVREKN